MTYDNYHLNCQLSHVSMSLMSNLLFLFIHPFLVTCRKYKIHTLQSRSNHHSYIDNTEEWRMNLSSNEIFLAHPGKFVVHLLSIEDILEGMFLDVSNVERFLDRMDMI